MVGYTRLVYLTPRKLYMSMDAVDYPYCYTPMCYICRSWCMGQVAIVRGGSNNRRKYTCLQCAKQVYPKQYLLSLLNKHIASLSRHTHTRKSLLKLYIDTKRMVKSESFAQ